MTTVLFQDGFHLEQLQKKHRRASFRCGEDAVDRWLKTRARQAQDKRLSVTRVLLDEDGVIAGYYTLAMGQVHFDELPHEHARQLPQTLLPIITLAWLGVDQCFQGTKLGGRILAQALSDCHVTGQAQSVQGQDTCVDCVSGRYSPTPGQAVCLDCDAGWDSAEGALLCTEICGDGVVVGVEACDDGNDLSEDGCLADCSDSEPGWVCPSEGGSCESVCGDGLVVDEEVCDDGNEISEDGCSADCSSSELGWDCPPEGGPCEPLCGDGMVVGDELCDDGNADNTDACLDTCVFAYCGDGYTRAGVEDCDDGNTDQSDGCLSTCKSDEDVSISGGGCNCGMAGDSTPAPFTLLLVFAVLVALRRRRTTQH